MAIPRIATYGMNGNSAVVYGLFDPRNGQIFYVGVTTQRLCNRLSGHYGQALNLMSAGPRNEIIRSIRAEGLFVEIAELETVHISRWVDAEQYWIQTLRFVGAALTNVAAGGPGNSGSQQSKETQLRRQRAAAGRDMSAVHSPESRRKARDGLAHKIIVEGQEFSGIRAASEATGISYGTLHRRLDLGIYQRITPRLRGKPSTLKGYISGEKHHNARPVMVEGRCFPTVIAAAKAIGLHPTTMLRRLRSGAAVYLDS